MAKCSWSLALVAVGMFVGAGSAQTLGVGDKAPKIEVGQFVKGDPVTEIEKGKTYVVEFWATWCGPCIQTIPHLTELQKKHKDVVFVGVSVWENDQADVAPFVEKMGEKMDYRVAMDAVPEGKRGNDGAMAKNWMTAAAQQGIPSAFIVNKEGVIAWIGHPARMDAPLEQIVAGTWDMEKAIADAKKEKERMKKMVALQAKLRAAQRSGDPKKLIAVFDEAIAEDAEIEQSLGMSKFMMLLQDPESVDAAAKYGEHLTTNVYKDNPQALNQIAWTIVDPDGPKRDAKLLPAALAAAKRADEVAKEKDPAIADTYAKTLFDSGKIAEAVKVQERAVKLAVGTQFESDEGLKNRLEEYKKALAEKK